jgi:hypothetical protein
MATTTNYGWTTPDDTALVKDGASAIRTLGSSVDTTTKALNPETTLGDLAYRSSTANVKTRLGLGSAGQFLAVNSGATAPEWQTLSAGGMTLISTTTLSGATTTISSIPQTYNSLLLIVSGLTFATSDKEFRLLPNNQTTLTSVSRISNATVSQRLNDILSLSGGNNLLRTDANNWWAVTFNNYTSTTAGKPCSVFGKFQATAAQGTACAFGAFNSTSALTSIVFDVEGVNLMSTGTVLLYGVK